MLDFTPGSKLFLSEISHIEEPLSNSSDDLVARGRKFYVSSYAMTVKGLCNNKM